MLGYFLRENEVLSSVQGLYMHSYFYCWRHVVHTHYICVWSVLGIQFLLFLFPTLSQFACTSWCGWSSIYSISYMRPFDLPCFLTYSHKGKERKSIGFHTLQGQGSELSSHSLPSLPPSFLACLLACHMVVDGGCVLVFLWEGGY